MPRKAKLGIVHGWVNFDKPQHVTSTQAVGRLRRLFGAGRAGHAGTLDPLATGILPIAFGEATKTVSHMQATHKAYEFTLSFGEMTRSDDVEGEVIARSDIRPAASDIEAVLPRFHGMIEQIPPQFSALKVNGRRAYELAREGQTLQLASRGVHIYELQLLEYDGATGTFYCRCAKGTYIRALGRDIAQAVGTYGHIIQLRRTQVGCFEQKTAFSLDALIKLQYESRVLEALWPVCKVLDDIPARTVTRQQAEYLRQGRAIVVPYTGDLQTILARYEGQAVALCEWRAGVLQPKRVFRRLNNGEDDVDIK